MPKRKPNRIDTSDRNIHYVPKDNPSSKVKQKKRIEDQISSTKKSIYSTNEEPIYQSVFFIGKSDYAKLFNYANKISKLIKLKGRGDKSQKFILDMYNILSNTTDEIICKKEAYRKMKAKAVTAKYTIQSDDNSRRIHLNTLHLAGHLKAYLCAMIYPPIFENCTSNSSDVIFSKYPMLIELWCNMLEEAIILDGFLDCIHRSILMMLDKRYDSIYCNNNKYDVKYNQPESSSMNSKNLLINLYKPNIMFTCRVKEFAIINNLKNIEHTKSIKSILQHNFFQSGNRGSDMHSYIKFSIKYIDKIYNSYIEYLENDYTKQIKEYDKNFNGKIGNLTKIFPLYNVCVKSHLLDFVWHDNFKSVDFHITEGFLTNYVLNKIMQQNNVVIKKLANTYEDEEFHYSKKYICNNSTELSLSNTIEAYDLHFLRLLIKQCSDTFQKYDLCFERNQAKSLIYTINDTESFILNDFYRHIIEHNLLRNPLDSIDQLEAIWEKSKIYYQTIYDDNYNIKFPC